MLEHIIPSKTRRKILKLFFQNVGENYHLRRVGREVQEEINAVKRELDILERGKVLNREKRLNKVIYSLNTRYIFFDEFLKIFAKESLLVSSILENTSRIGKLKYFVLSMKFIKRKKISEGEVYILFVGTVVVPELVQLISSEEKRLNMEINYTAMSEEEFSFRKRNNDPFIWSFLKQPKLVVIGEEEVLMK